MERVNKQLNREIDASYLAYACEYVANNFYRDVEAFTDNAETVMGMEDTKRGVK